MRALHVAALHHSEHCAGPAAAARILDAAADEMPLSKCPALRAAALEIDFWQALRHGDIRAARAHAAKLTTLPQPNGKTEFDARRAAAARAHACTACVCVDADARVRAGRMRRSCS
jgi:hypothetical protein